MSFNDDRPLYGDDTAPDRSPRRKRSPWLIAGLCALVVSLVGGIGTVLTFTVFIPQSVISEGVQMEGHANSNAGAAFGAMDTCVQTTARAAQVTQANADAVDKILKNAVSGRYGTGAQLNRNQLFSALQEAYPSTVDVSKLYDKALSEMTGCQKDFLAAQNAMNTYANAFEAWTAGSWRTRSFGGNQFPDERLHVIIGDKTITGAQALKIMQRQVVESDTANAILSGIRSGNNSSNYNPFAPTPSATH